MCIRDRFRGFRGFVYGPRRIFPQVRVCFCKAGAILKNGPQRFSSAATTLSRAPVLEDEYEFAEWLRDHMKPPGSRDLHVEVLNSTYDFQTWLHGLDIQVTGLAPAPSNPFTNHVWRFVRRDQVARLLAAAPAVIECRHGDFASEEDPSDAVLLTRTYLHSNALSQNPLLVLPRSRSAMLEKTGLKVVLTTSVFWANGRRPRSPPF